MVSRTSLGVSAYASIVSGDFLRVGSCAQIGRTKPGERGNVKVKDDTLLGSYLYVLTVMSRFSVARMSLLPSTFTTFDR